MKKFLFAFLFTAVSAFSEIKTVRSLEEVFPELQSISNKSIVLFDVDEVLATPQDILAKPEGKTIVYNCPEPLTDEQVSIMIAGTKFVHVHPKTPAVVKSLLDRKIPTIAFTACRTGAFGVIQSAEEWRFQQLADLELDFSSSFDREEIFTHLVDPDANPPLFQKGILYCGDFYDPKVSTKGKLLGVFLDWLGWKPKSIIFIDDELKNLKAVEEELQKRKIPLQGFHLDRNGFFQLDKKVAELQLKILFEHKKWLSDEDAKEQLK